LSAPRIAHNQLCLIETTPSELIVKKMDHQDDSSLARIPVDILKSIFSWISQNSIDACLLKQTNRFMNWLLVEYVGWEERTTMNIQVPLHHDAPLIVKHLPPLDAEYKKTMALIALKHGQFHNFECLHEQSVPITVGHVVAPVEGGHLDCFERIVHHAQADQLDGRLYKAAINKALHKATLHGRRNIVNYILVTQKAHLNHNSDSAILNACANGRMDIIKLLEVHGLRIVDTCAKSAFRVASANGCLKVVQYIHKIAKEQLNRLQISDAFNAAATSSLNLELLKYLHSLGAGHVNRANVVTPSRAGRLEIVKFLHSKGADVHYMNDSALVEACEYGHLETVKFLCSIGLDVHILQSMPLRRAVGVGYVEVVKYLHSVGSDIHVMDDYAFRTACLQGDLEMAKFLHSVGANIHADNDSAIRWASHNGFLELVVYLHSIGADIHVDDDGPFRWACRNGHLKVVAFLHSIGANIHAENDYGMQWAIIKKHTDVVEFLQLLEFDATNLHHKTPDPMGPQVS
jgi:ankyrin repeat protein